MSSTDDNIASNNPFDFSIRVLDQSSTASTAKTSPQNGGQTLNKTESIDIDINKSDWQKTTDLVSYD